MDFELPEEYRILRDNIRRFTDRELIPINEEVERTKKIPDRIIDQMKEMGLFGILTPEEFGGMGMSIVGCCIIQEELSRANLLLSHVHQRQHRDRHDGHRAFR